MADQIADLNEADTAPERETRTKITKVVAIGACAVGSIIVAVDQAKRFKKRKTPKLTVVEKTED